MAQKKTAKKTTLAKRPKTRVRPGAPRTQQQKAEVYLREQRCLQLRLAGASYQEIAEAVGFANRGAAYLAISRILDRYAEDARESARQVRQINVERYNRLILSLWERAVGGELYAIDRVVLLMSRIEKLHGLDSIKLEVSEVTAIIDAFRKSGDRESLERIASGEDAMRVAIDKLARERVIDVERVN